MKQYQFSLKDECMKELTSIKEPKSYTGHPDNDHEIKLYINRLAEYEKHLASLQSIPVPKIYLSSFTDGKIYNEDELEIKCNYIPDGNLHCKNCGSIAELCNCEKAIPKQKIDGVEQWRKRELFDALKEVLVMPCILKRDNARKRELKEYFTITRE